VVITLFVAGPQQTTFTAPDCTGIKENITRLLPLWLLY